MPHRTTNHGSAGNLSAAPWLVSMAMWSNFMQFVSDGVTVGELQRLTRLSKKSLFMWLARMGKWWGYVVVESNPVAGNPARPGPESIVRPTAAGRRVQQVWGPLGEIIEKRWQTRFGEAQMGRLRELLWALISEFDVNLPDYLPVLGYGLFAEANQPQRDAHAQVVSGLASSALPTLLSKVLFAFIMEFERDSGLSLAMCSNVLRVLDEDAMQVRELPRRTGVAREAVKHSVSFLQKQHYVVVESDPTAKGAKLVRLTLKGRDARDAYARRLRAIEKEWQERFGEEKIRNLKESLETFIGTSALELSPLSAGLKPYPDGWRASLPAPETLPHYPMILHRGGFPDGS